jgi:polysaccharide deacetylase family protein (PEP-CTERM system associated)
MIKKKFGQPGIQGKNMPNLLLNVLTIDVEDWDQLAHYKLLGRSVPASKRVLANTHLLLDLLAEYNVRGTFFVLGAVAERFPELVLRIKQEGHEVATHGFAHRRIAQLGPKAFEADLCRSIHILEDIIQERVWGHRAAEFSLSSSTQWALEIMAAAGLRYDSSLFPIHHPRYGISTAPRQPYLIHTPAGTLVEFPLATLRFLGQNIPFAGGGYLRLLPLPFVHWGIQTLNQQRQMVVIYVHPYEFEEAWLDLPVPTVSTRQRLNLRLRAWKRNWGRGRPMQAKFKALLGSFPFVPLREVMIYETKRADSNLFSTARPTI